MDKCNYDGNGTCRCFYSKFRGVTCDRENCIDFHDGEFIIDTSGIVRKHVTVTYSDGTGQQLTCYDEKGCFGWLLFAFLINFSLWLILLAALKVI